MAVPSCHGVFTLSDPVWFDDCTYTVLLAHGAYKSPVSDDVAVYITADCGGLGSVVVWRACKLVDAGWGAAHCDRTNPYEQWNYPFGEQA